MRTTDLSDEERLLEVGVTQGLAVRVHVLESFRIDMVAVLDRGETCEVVRRVVAVGPFLTATPESEERFSTTPKFLAKLHRRLGKLGFDEAEDYFEEGGLDGVSLESRRLSGGGCRRLAMFGWSGCADASIRRLGDYLERLALASVRRLRWRALLSRFW